MKTLDDAAGRALRRLGQHADLARALGVDSQRWYQWRTGLRPMPVRKLRKLAALAGVDPVRLIGEYQLERDEGKDNARSESALHSLSC